MKALYVLLIAILLAGCGPSAEQMTATAIMAKAQTQTAAPTFTPTFTSTPTVTPTLTPSPTITPSPTPALPTVAGLIQLNFVPVNDKTIIPQPPFQLAVTFKTGDQEIKVDASNTDGDFTTHMEPGRYTISSVTIQSEALGNTPLDIITERTEIEISAQPCQDLGAITFNIIRLPPGDFGEQVALVQKLAKGEQVFFKFLETGGLIMPAFTEITGSDTCPDLPQAPDGFHWKYRAESAMAFLAPDGWNYKREQSTTTKAYFSTLENIDTNGTFKTGLTIQVIQDKNKNAAQVAKNLYANITSQNAVTKSSKVSEHTDGNLVFYEFEYEASAPTYNTTVHNLMVANTATNTLYVITFESPTDQWGEAWEIGQVIMEQIQFLGEN